MTKLSIALNISKMKKAFFYQKKQHYRRTVAVDLQIRNDEEGKQTFSSFSLYLNEIYRASQWRVEMAVFQLSIINYPLIKH